MFRFLIDTCVWLDLAKDPHQQGLVGALAEMVHLKKIELIVPRTVVSEFQRNRDRVAKESAKSLSSVFKRVREAVDKFGDGKRKRAALAQIDDVGHKVPLLGGGATAALDRIEKMLLSSDIIEVSDAIKLRAAKRAIEGKAPFHKNRNSFSDAVIAETYAEALKSGPARTRFAFVTHNTHDFSAPSGNQKHPHPDLAPMFSRIKSLYFIRMRDALLRVHPELAADLLLDHEWIDEPRSLSEILATLTELTDKVWYNRHQVLRQKIERGQVKLVDKETFPVVDHRRRPIQRDVWAGAQRAARRKERKYGKANLGPWTDFEWGLLSGKLSALRWMLGDEWEWSLDT